MEAAPVREAPPRVRLRRSLTIQTALPFLGQYFGSFSRRLPESWCAALRGVRPSPAGWLSLLQCSMPLAAAPRSGRYTSWFQARNGSRTAAAPGQRKAEYVPAANGAAMEVLRFLWNFRCCEPTRRPLGSQTSPAAATPLETIPGFGISPELLTGSGRPGRRNCRPAEYRTSPAGSTTHRLSIPR